MFNIPHKIILVDTSLLTNVASARSTTERLACVADRENGRIQCFTIPYGYYKFQIQLEEFNGRLFSIAFDPRNRILYAVAGPSLYDQSKDVLAFGFSVDSQKLRTIFGPNKGVIEVKDLFFKFIFTRLFSLSSLVILPATRYSSIQFW